MHSPPAPCVLSVVLGALGSQGMSQSPEGGEQRQGEVREDSPGFASAADAAAGVVGGGLEGLE